MSVLGREIIGRKSTFEAKGQFGTIANWHKARPFGLEMRKRYSIIGMVSRIMVAENLIAFKRALSAFKANII